MLTPITALTTLLNNGDNTTKRKIVCGLSKHLRPLAKRLTRYTPRTASRVLPAAMARELGTVPAVSRLVRKAPARMAGQYRNPNTSKAENAIPLGAHTVEMLGLLIASAKPSFPATR